MISTGLSWLRVPVLINLFSKQFQAARRRPSWYNPTKFQRDFSKYGILYSTICDPSSRQFGSIQFIYVGKLEFRNISKCGELQNRQF